MNCRPVDQTHDWPGREQLAELLWRQLDRILAILEFVADDRLSLAADQIIHGLHDEAKHSGEMYLLFKICRKRI